MCICCHSDEYTTIVSVCYSGSMEVMDNTGIALECDAMLDSLQRELQSIKVISVNTCTSCMLMQELASYIFCMSYSIVTCICRMDCKQLPHTTALRKGNSEL